MLSQEAKVVQLALSGAEGPAAAGGVGQFDTRHFADPMKNKVNYKKKIVYLIIKKMSALCSTWQKDRQTVTTKQLATID